MLALIYLDYNCFQRGFDDPRQVQIQMEALACQAIFSMAEQGQISLAWSFMHQDETSVCPFPTRQQEAVRLAGLCKVRIGPDEAIYDLATKFQQKANLSAKDAIHVACAAHSAAVAFISCDDSLIRRARRLNLPLKIANPVDFVRREEW
jgi:hypothetical protein